MVQELHVTLFILGLTTATSLWLSSQSLTRGAARLVNSIHGAIYRYESMYRNTIVVPLIPTIFFVTSTSRHTFYA